MYLQFLVLFDKNSEIILLEKKILKLVYSGKRLINKTAWFSQVITKLHTDFTVPCGPRKELLG